MATTVHCSATATELAVLQVDAAVHAIEPNPQPMPCPEIQALVEENADLFSGIGKLKEGSVQIHIDESVPPTVQPHRRMTFNIRDKAEEELERLEKPGIIENLTGPTPWVSSMVCIPKPRNSNEVRCYIDMRLPNKAVKRERHRTPTINELIQDLAKAATKIVTEAERLWDMMCKSVTLVPLP